MIEVKSYNVQRATVVKVVSCKEMGGATSMMHRDSNPRILNPGIPDHFLNPESRDWRFKSETENQRFSSHF